MRKVKFVLLACLFTLLAAFPAMADDVQSGGGGCYTCEMLIDVPSGATVGPYCARPNSGENGYSQCEVNSEGGTTACASYGNPCCVD
jgi:hypothetical protein